MLKIEQKNNQNFGAFVAFYDDEKAGTMQYEWKNALIFNITHTEVDSKFGGKGIAKSLIFAALDYARKEGKKINATCPFAKSVLEKDETVQDIFVKN
ncbi:GNAT family N-acetyltransferase [Halpernia sp.]|uniref:GNAT family N-acetyltransferase n=1 Tax=Halpernia sp. TaxID=2782209 RepID=UPI003A94DDC1